MREPVRIAAHPHPLRPQELLTSEIEEGASIADIVGPSAGSGVEVRIRGHLVPREWWPRIRPRAGETVQIRVRPHDDSLKRDILTIAVIVASAYTGGAVGAAYGAGWGAAAAAGVSIAGSMLTNALVPIQQPLQPAQQSNYNSLTSLTGTQNKSNQWGPPPTVFGTMRYFPPLAANPYTEISGDEQYLRILLNLGYGNLSIDPANIEIGGTAIASYGNVEYEIGAPGAIKLFANDIVETTPGDVLSDDGTGPYAVHTTDVATTEISLDIIFQNGLYGIAADGSFVQLTAGFTIEYSTAGSGIWKDVATDAGVSGITFANDAMSINFSTSVGGLRPFEVVGQARKPLRLGVRFKVASDQYDVRVSRISGPPYTYAGAVNHVSDAVWETFRSIHNSAPYSIANTTLLAIRAKSSDRLNGSLSQVSVLASQQVPTYDTGTHTWSADTVTNNPAWQYVWALKGAGGANKKARTDAQIDLDAIASWAADCTAAGHEYNAVIDSQTTVDQILRDIAAAGLASFSRNLSKYSIVQDIDRATPVQVFTPRNSSNFSVTRNFVAPPHALRVQFTNPNANWQTDEFVVYWDGYNAGGSGGLTAATKFETFEARGCCTPDEAWRIGRYQLAVRWLRLNSYSWNCDVEHIVCTRGDMVQVSHDVVQVGQGWARIKSQTTDGGSPPKTTEIVVDAGMDFDGVSAYAITVRRNDGTMATSIVTAPGGGAQSNVRTLTLTTPLAGVNVGDLIVFGLSGTQTRDLIILNIKYAQSLGAQIFAVDRNPAIQTAGSGTPPAFTSAITGVPWCDPPPVPDLSVVLSGSVLARAVSGAGGADKQVPLNPPDHGGVTPPVIVIGTKLKTP